MLIKSFVKTDFGFRPVTVEVVLVPGVSQIQILGLPDQVIKESSKRIIAALRHQGFRLPPGKQALVNLHPIDLRKSSQGLDLPIALGILIESEQVEVESFNFRENYCYGALSLKGEVQVPPDLDLLNFEKFQSQVMTGATSLAWRFDVYEVSCLKDICEGALREGNQHLLQCEFPVVASGFRFDDHLARLMEIVAIGEHPLLVAGYAGSGKTTLVENLAMILNPPEEKNFLEAQKYWKLSGRELRGRPIVQPHHSATPASMVGGGRPLQFGEISLAHGGALILDELLEFHPLVQSALREPMEKGVIHLSRVGMRQVFPAQSLVLATTNLCPCGNFKPGAIYSCRCSSLKLRAYVEKLTGPFLDRFSIFHIFEKPKLDMKTGLIEIQERVKKGFEFRRSHRNQDEPNQKLELDVLLKQLGDDVITNSIPYTKSHRRRLSLLRVARTLADMEQVERVRQSHLEEAQYWTASDMYKLERFRSEDFAGQ